MLQGALEFDAVASLFERVNFDDLADPAIRIDLSGIDSVDSAGLALCLEWISLANSRSVAIVFRGVPEQLRRLASLNQVEDLFAESDAS